MNAWSLLMVAALPCSCGLSWSRTSSEGTATAVPMDLKSFEFTDAAAFRMADEGSVPCLELHRKADYTPPHRSPAAMAIVKDRNVGDFALEVDVQQTTVEYPHRDLVFVFGYQDRAHFCYAHLASKADDSAHQVQLVDAADRRPVTVWRTGGVAWGEGWHRIRLDRRGHQVTVEFDGQVVLRGETPPWRGSIGVGSFDDTGRFRDLRLLAR